jgi:hypothetical protein
LRTDTVFFSFTEVPDRAHHIAYNEWHQLDHRPENLDLDGVRWGERWVRTPRCAAASEATDELAATHYVNLYWFRSPAAAAIAEWQQLAERSFQWGRRADVAIATRLMMGFFTTVKGYAAPRVRVSADALVFRPTTGVHVLVTRLADPHAVASEQLATWYDAVYIPTLLERVGVAGAWTFSSASTTLDPSWSPVEGSTTFEMAGNDRGLFRVVVCFLDHDDPVAMGGEVNGLWRESRAQLAAGLGDAEAVVLASPLESITPWQWDWFDHDGT